MEHRAAEWLLLGTLSVLLIVVVLISVDLPVSNDFIFSALVFVIISAALAAIISVLPLIIRELRIMDVNSTRVDISASYDPLNITDSPARLPRLP